MREREREKEQMLLFMTIVSKYIDSNREISPFTDLQWVCMGSIAQI